MQMWMDLLAEVEPPGIVLDVTSFILDDAGSLPFDDHHAGMVISYRGLHNCPAIPRALQEMARICQPSGYLAISDDIAPEDLDAAAYINAWHTRYHPTYQWTYAQREWRELIQRAGFCLVAEQTLRQRTHFASWPALSGIAPAVVDVMRQELFHAPPLVRDFLNPHLDGGERYFDHVQGFWLGRKAVS